MHSENGVKNLKHLRKQFQSKRRMAIQGFDKDSNNTSRRFACAMSSSTCFASQRSRKVTKRVRFLIEFKMSQFCFVCAGDCKDSYFFLINLTSKKFKTKFTTLIGDFISSEYELRITDDNKICERCAVIIEKYDELKHEAKTVKSVLGRQIAQTYGIESNETMVYMDKSKIFAELGAGSVNKTSKYSCKLCPHFVTDSIDLINTHCLYHKITTENKIDEVRTINDVTPVPKRNHPISIRRETPSSTDNAKTTAHASMNQQRVNRSSTLTSTVEVPSVPIHDESSINLDHDDENDKYDEEVLDTLIDLDLLEDPHCDSNLKNNQCMVTGCTKDFKYISDYVRHLKLRHKSTLNHIFAVVRANIKRPTKQNKFMCPYCFTKLSSSETLQFHVKEHEEAAKSNLFVERLGDFVSNIMSSSRCKICDWEISDPSVLDCSHEIAKNGMATKITCSLCSQNVIFYSEKLYNNHLASEHGHCFICGQVSTSDDKMVLVDHIRSHLA